MLHSLLLALRAVLWISSAMGFVFLAGASFCVARFARRPYLKLPAALPHITVLKPVAGSDPDLYDDLASFCDQRYPAFDIVFCVHDQDDPALPVVRRVVAAFPQCATRIEIGSNPAHLNPKIANLSKAAGLLSGEIVAIADSDIRVDDRYLAAVAAAFADERVGGLTMLYTGRPNETIVSALGAQRITEQFAPSVLVALALGELRFALGATMAARSSALAAIGGIDALGGYLADDHAFGNLIAKAGWRVELSRYVVETAVPERKLTQLWHHELRWARTTYLQARAGYAFSYVMYALPLAALYALLSGNAMWGLSTLAAVAVARYTLHAVARRAFAVTTPGRPFLVPVRDAMSLAIWAQTFFGRNVRWRERRIEVDPDGRLVYRVAQRSSERA
jgi:ceramide glucosyltransferase